MNLHVTNWNVPISMTCTTMCTSVEISNSQIFALYLRIISLHFNLNIYQSFQLKTQPGLVFYRLCMKHEGRYCFHGCLSVYTCGRGGLPIPGQDVGGGVTPFSGLDRGVPLSQVWTGRPGIDGVPSPTVSYWVWLVWATGYNEHLSVPFETSTSDGQNKFGYNEYRL